MSKGRPLSVIPLTLKFAHILPNIAIGLALLYFFLGYQPSLEFPTIKPAIVHAQAAEQSQTVQAGSFPFSFQLPHPGYLSTPYSAYHPGIDIATGLGMPIKPIARGTVVNTGFSFWGLGLVVEVDHGQGYHSVYAHMGKIFVKNGQIVTEGDILGEVGLTGNTTGPHTHLELTKDSVKIDPLPLLPTIRRYPTEQDFVAQGSTATQSAYLSKSTPTKTITGGRTQLPQIAPKVTPTPTPKPIQPTYVTQLEVTQVLTPSPTPKPLISF